MSNNWQKKLSYWKSSASITAIIVASGLATPALTTTASADGLAGRTNWSGFYVGAHVGAGEANWDGAFKNQSTTDTVFMDDLGETGVLGGFHAGYNWQYGKTVFGIEGEVSFLDVEGTANAIASSEEATSELDALASVRARLGVTLGDSENVLLYVAGGIAWADAEATVFESGRNSDTVSQFDFDDVGGTVATGFEYAMTDQFRLRVEGAYYWFDDNQDIVNFGNFSEADAGDFIELEDVYTFKVGGTFYFNSPKRATLK